MQRLTLSRLLGLLTLLPLLALLAFATVLTARTVAAWRDVGRVSSVQALVSATARLGAVAFPAEGGPAIGYFQTGAADVRAILTTKRSETDAAITAFRAAVAASTITDAGTAEDIDFMQTRLRDIGAFRQKVDARQADMAAVVSYLAPIAVHGAELIGHLTRLSKNEEIPRLFLGYNALLHYVDGASKEMATGIEAFTSGRLPPASVPIEMEGISIQETFGKIVEDLGPPAIAARMRSLHDSAFTHEIEAMRQEMLGSAPLPPDHAARWAAAAFERRDRLFDLVIDYDSALAAVTHSLQDRAGESLAGYGGSVMLAVGLVVLLTWLVLRSVRTLLAGQAKVMTTLMARDFTAEVPGRERHDEIGLMARTLVAFRDSMAEGARLAEAREAERLATEARAARLEALVRGFEAKAAGIVGALSTASSGLHGTAQSMSESAAHTSERASVVASAAEQTSANVQTVASATEELVASVGEISRQVAQSAAIADKAVGEAKRTDATVRTLAEGAQRIGDVVNLISSIAGQTNLLALNATIEAARAGEAGRGFAVVASEVKTLASQTAKATEEIAGQVGQIQSATSNVVAAIGSIAATIGEASQIAGAIAAAVEEQGAATREIARSVQQAAAGTQEVTRNITEVGEAASGTGSGARLLLDAAGDLAQQAEGLRAEVGDFTAQVRAV
jgi:methyl-accepting chemotaxis protein